MPSNRRLRSFAGHVERRMAISLAALLSVIASGAVAGDCRLTMT